ncbi:MAG: Ig-like domain-containing protein, partial [Candidatus Poribacteria bacterium]
MDVEISSDGTGNLFTQAVGSTDALGGGSGAIATTSAGLKTITVTADPSGTAVPLTQQPTVLFDPDIDALLSTAVAVPATDVVADGVTTADIVVTVLDSLGAPLAGQTVEIAATGTNNTVVQAPAVTDGVGQATATVATTLAELKTISVTINALGTPVALAMQPTVQFIGDAANISPTLSSASANPTGLIVADGNAVSTVTVTLKDINDNVVPNASVEIASDGTGNVLAQPAAATDVSGVTTATIATTFAELKTITVTGEPLGAAVVLGDQPTALFDPDVSATLSTILAAPRIGVVADGIALSTLTITVVDSTGTPMPGQIVEIASDGTNNTIVQPPTATDVAGQAIATIASTTAELKMISITVNSAGTPVVLTTQPTVEFIGDAANISAALSEVVALPAIDVVANGIATSDVTITLKDINDNRVPGVTVELASDGTSNTITQRTGPTSTAGIAVAMVASTKAELKTFTITADPTGAAVILTTQPTAQFIGDAANVSSVLSTVMASPTLDVVANGVDASTVTVVIKDINDNLVPAAEVVLS